MTTAVQQTNVNPAQAIYGSLNPVAADKTAVAGADSQDRFLKLLVTQLKNQDPLNPMDNAQMTSQLAQISTVDGITKLNATLQSMLDNNNQSQALQAAGLVGHSVMVPGSGMSLQSGMAVGGIELNEPADSVTISIKDSSGAVLKTIELSGVAAGNRGFAWDGVTDSGAQAADGQYQFSVKAKRGEDNVSAQTLEMGVVSSISRSSQGVSLNVGALGMFKISDVREIL